MQSTAKPVASSTLIGILSGYSNDTPVYAKARVPVALPTNPTEWPDILTSTAFATVLGDKRIRVLQPRTVYADYGLWSQVKDEYTASEFAALIQGRLDNPLSAGDDLTANSKPARVRKAKPAPTPDAAPAV